MNIPPPTKAEWDEAIATMNRIEARVQQKMEADRMYRDLARQTREVEASAKRNSKRRGLLAFFGFQASG